MPIEEIKARRKTAARELDERITKQASLEARLFLAQEADEENDRMMEALTVELADLDERIVRLESKRPIDRGVAGAPRERLA